MNFLVRATLMLATAAAVGGCQKTVRTELPRGAEAYERIAVPPEVVSPSIYLLRVGDGLNVIVWREEEFSAEKVPVDRAGNITLPMIGAVPAAGRTQQDVAADVTARLAASYLRNPRVSVIMDKPAEATVSVEGEVELPGVYEIEPGQTLLTALALARSPTDTAKLDEVLVFRTVNGQRMGARFDLAEIRAGRVPDPQILPGDVVVVGFSQVRAVYQDILRASPLFNVFTQF